VCGIDVLRMEKKPAEPEPFVKPEGGKVEAMQVHTLKKEDDVTNLTKDAELIVACF